MPDPLVAGQLALEDFDAITLDMQHGANDIHSVALGVAQVTLAGKPTIVRIPVGQFATASRVLDLGVAGVIAPMINSKEDAKAFASFMKYPPIGERSWGPTIAFGLTGTEGNDYMKAGNAITVAIAMVETREALAAVDDILATPGIDAVFVGRPIFRLHYPMALMLIRRARMSPMRLIMWLRGAKRIKRPRVVCAKPASGDRA